MGISLSSIHIFSDRAAAPGFRCFSKGWQTCTVVPDEPDKAELLARDISLRTDSPVLFFDIFDSEAIELRVFIGGKAVSRYSDSDFIPNRKLFDIPGFFGIPEGQKRRLSAILGCGDAELKAEMLEEYLGLCLLYTAEAARGSKSLCRERGDALYSRYVREEKLLSGKAAPYAMELIDEQHGKLFAHQFGDQQHRTKDGYYFLGYDTPDSIYARGNLRPVHFAGGKLLAASEAELFREQPYPAYDDPRFTADAKTPRRLNFTELCPPDFRGRSMLLPAGFFPEDFGPDSELILSGKHRLCVVDSELKIVAKLPFKGEYCGMADGYILTAMGDSFFAYTYDPKARICIYKFSKKD